MRHQHTVLSALIAVSLSLMARPSEAATQWSYLSSYDKNGVPSAMVDLSNELPPGLLNSIYARLPEYKDIRLNDPTLITDDLGANINLVEDAEVTVAFLNEAAGYNNSVGYFTYDSAKKPTAVSALKTQIMFPNFSLPFLKYGNAVQLGKLKAGTAVGFTIAANGWNGSGVNPNQPTSMLFQTLKGLNPEAPGTANLNAHTVLLSKPEDGLLILGFEDMNRTPGQGSDNDFNDAVIAIKVTPFSAVDRSQISALTKVVKDSDGDGIADDLDAFPLDPLRAARRFYPSATGYGNLAFEDNWPKKGDFDMNDLLVGYRAVEVLNARNETVDLQLQYQLKARGAQNDNAFAVHLPGVPRTAINPATTTVTIGSQAPVALAAESGQTDAVFILTNSANSLTKTGLGWPCGFFNTVNNCPRLAPVPLVADIHFQQPLKAGQLGRAPYNPFIYPNRYAGRGREIHLVDHPPTAKADPKWFGTENDASLPAQGRYYRTTDNQPWALDVPETWRYPAEWNSIANAYANFTPWALGINSLTTTNWYINNINQGLVFQP